MSSGPQVKDIEHLLLNKQKCRRRQWELPYPIIYPKDLADFDIWDHMFRVSYCKSLTMHQFAEPPALTLDLGCGSGFWAIEAAKQWKNSTIIGFDVAEIQPRLRDMRHFDQLARRINWIHGNLLDGLPFPSNHFDFVRIVGMGLAIPEDEWQPVLEEVYRVLKPGAVLEVIEEDLLFPSPSSQLQKPKSLPASPLIQSPLMESPVLPQQSRLPKKRSTLFSDKSNTSSESASSASSETANSKSKITNFLPSLYTLRQASTMTLIATPSTHTESYTETEHPQDHTRLKTAWDAMLTTRFLSPNLLSVLPFYLTSASFSVEVHPLVLVPLPPNSGTYTSLKSFQSMGSLHYPDRSSGTVFDFQPALSNKSIKTNGFSMRTSFSLGPRPHPHAWGTMHLAKTASVVKGCREAIWLEYKKLYSEDPMEILARTAPDDEDYDILPHLYLVQKAFEVDWNNWDYDMTDRMEMRKNLLLHAAWAQPMSGGDKPKCRIWREKLDGKDDDNKCPHLLAAHKPDDLCRSLRAFTGRKT